MLTRARTDQFAAHPTDCLGPTNAIMARVAEQGLATVDGLVSRESVLAFTRRVMELTRHPDSDADGLTTIRDIGRASPRPGLAGLGSGELLAHTERSSTPCPPRLMLLVCLRPAVEGGEVLLTDGRAVYEELAVRSPEAVEAMGLRGTAYFGDGGGHSSRIFTPHPDGRVSLRFRQDELGRFSPLVSDYLPALRGAITAHEHLLRLEPGQGYLIDNTRFLHARASFVGHRLCVRALGTPLLPLADGFAVSGPARSRPVASPGKVRADR
ncbi:TauD/TfdA family dioxygenase [Streptomyces goshikiensis]|uniref:TauD/TfdA family dioxygenase n=1 Tax=Streptomyces goshikiensis TaxID=1942 RepID=UPI003654D72B